MLWEFRQGILLSTLHCRMMPESCLPLLYETEDLTAGNQLFCQNEVNHALNRICIQSTCSWMKVRFFFNYYLMSVFQEFQMCDQRKSNWPTCLSYTCMKPHLSIGNNLMNQNKRDSQFLPQIEVPCSSGYDLLLSIQFHTWLSL